MSRDSYLINLDKRLVINTYQGYCTGFLIGKFKGDRLCIDHDNNAGEDWWASTAIECGFIQCDGNDFIDFSQNGKLNINEPDLGKICYLGDVEGREFMNVIDNEEVCKNTQIQTGVDTSITELEYPWFKCNSYEEYVEALVLNLFHKRYNVDCNMTFKDCIAYYKELVNRGISEAIQALNIIDITKAVKYESFDINKPVICTPLIRALIELKIKGTTLPEDIGFKSLDIDISKLITDNSYIKECYQEITEKIDKYDSWKDLEGYQIYTDLKNESLALKYLIQLNYLLAGKDILEGLRYLWSTPTLEEQVKS